MAAGRKNHRWDVFAGTICTKCGLLRHRTSRWNGKTWGSFLIYRYVLRGKRFVGKAPPCPGRGTFRHTTSMGRIVWPVLSQKEPS